MSTWLIDTGPIVAYLVRSDPAHTLVSPALDAFEGLLVTTGATITEAMHFVAGAQNGPQSLAEFVRRSQMRVYDLCQPPELREAARLMTRYADTPMDFADATLVLLAEALGAHDVVTLDRRGFSTYRTRPGDALRLVLDSP